VGDSNDDYMNRFRCVNDAEGKTTHQDMAETVADAGAQLGVRSNGSDCVLHVIEKIVARPAVALS
jgi:hypothetical protein